MSGGTDATRTVYLVSSWRHGTCYLATLDEALAHVEHDLAQARPGEVRIRRRRVSRRFWDALPATCDHALGRAADGDDEAALPDGQVSQVSQEASHVR
ncbi:MAG: hypothetical protein ACRDJN_32255 [Chloroflexota bacterium]